MRAVVLREVGTAPPWGDGDALVVEDLVLDPPGPNELSGGGVDHAFAAVGSGSVLAEAHAATGRGGTTTAIGLPHPGEQLVVPAVSLAAEGRTIQGSSMGSTAPQRDVPRLVGPWRAGRLPVERLHSHTVTLDGLPAAMNALRAGEVVRQVLQPH